MTDEQHLNRIRQQALEALGREDNGLSTVSELVDVLADELAQTRRLLELEQRKVEVTPDEAYALLGGVLNKTRRDLDQAQIRAEQCEQAAESLARIVGFLTGEDIGEHENGNDPWANAMEAGKEALPLRAALEQAEACIIATRQMANDANAALRTQLLAALGWDDDGKTPLSQYVADLVVELVDTRTTLTATSRALAHKVWQIPAELAEARRDLDTAREVARSNKQHVAYLTAEFERVEAERVQLAADRDRLRDANDGLVLTLAEILGQFRVHGHPGRAAIRTDWIDAATIDRWRRALNDAEPDTHDHDPIECACELAGVTPPPPAPGSATRAPESVRAVQVTRPTERQAADPDRPIRLTVVATAYADLNEAEARQIAQQLLENSQPEPADTGAFNAGVSAAADAIEQHAEAIGWYEGGGVWADAIEQARKAATR